jgi:hypothetical protein
MKNPSRALLALYERCLIGGLLACEVTSRELDGLSVEDFSDPRAQRSFAIIAELSEDAPLEFPSAHDIVAAAVPEAHADRLHGYLREAYTDFVTRHVALAYAKLVAKYGKERRLRETVAARIAGRRTA